MSPFGHVATPTCTDGPRIELPQRGMPSCPMAVRRPAARQLTAVSCWACRRKDEDEEGMEDWDQDKLEEVIAQKHSTEKNRPTDIICKFFLDAVEKKVYGWCAVESNSHCWCSLCPFCWPPHWLMCPS